jgi:hypothetical protein
MISVLVALIIGVEPVVVSLKSCQADVVSQIVKDSDAAAPYLIMTASGHIFRIFGQDFIDPRTWRKGEAISVCPDDKDRRFAEITNTHRKERLVTWINASPR